MIPLELVVARYEEDLAWLRKVPRSICCTVYNKGQTTTPTHSTPLPNLGHESQTYLHHIVSRYDSLNAITIFCQGHPFDHASDFHKVLRQLHEGTLSVKNFLWLGFIIEWDDPKGARIFQNWSKNPARDLLDLDYFCRQLFGEPAPSRFIFYPGAQFVVTKETIHQRPLDFYQKALAFSETIPHAAHCFERTWDRIFQVNGLPEEFSGKELPFYLKKIRRLQDD